MERFNGTFEYEWLYDCNLTTDCDEFNPAVTNWLIEYNFNRPHQALDYLTPMRYIVRITMRILPSQHSEYLDESSRIDAHRLKQDIWNWKYRLGRDYKQWNFVY
ncbi:transposase [bacterium]|nr:transposase [bacterium]